MMTFFRILFVAVVLASTLAATYSLMRVQDFKTIYSEHDGRRINP